MTGQSGASLSGCTCVRRAWVSGGEKIPWVDLLGLALSKGSRRDFFKEGGYNVNVWACPHHQALLSH